MATTPEPYSRLQDSDNNVDGPATTAATQHPQRSEQQQEKPRHKYKTTLYQLGIAEVVIGSLSILLAIVTLIEASKYQHYRYSYYSSWEKKTVYYDYSYHHGLTYSSQGIWGGAFILVSGILGIKAKSRPSVCTYNANMALSIVAAVVALVSFILEVIAASTNMSYYGSRYRIYSLVVIHGVLAALAFCGGVVCIVHSAYCCRGVCCRRQSYRGGIAYYAQPQGGQQAYQMVQLQNGQFILVPYQQSVASPLPMAPVVCQPPMYQPVVSGMPPAQVPLGPNQYPAMNAAAQPAGPSVQPISGYLEQK